MVIVGTPPQASEHYPPPPVSRGCTQSFHRAFLAGPAGAGFSAGINRGQVAAEALARVFAQTPDGRPSAECGMEPDRVVGSHEMPGIPPALVESGCDGGGFVELLAPGALAPLDAAILFDPPWLDDRHGHVALLEEFFENAAEPGAVVGLAPG